MPLDVEKSKSRSVVSQFFTTRVGKKEKVHPKGCIATVFLGIN